jgi:YHS domain-containing protein
MVRDPVCGIEVNPREGYSTKFEGQVYNFCSVSCKEKFEKNPIEYTKIEQIDHDSGEHEGHGGGCCGVGVGRGWMGCIHLAMMIIFFLLLLLLSR